MPVPCINDLPSFVRLVFLNNDSHTPQAMVQAMLDDSEQDLPVLPHDCPHVSPQVYNVSNDHVEQPHNHVYDLANPL